MKIRGVFRLIALVLLAWAGGFLWFSVMLPRPAGSERTDAIIVLTGAEGRLARGVEVMEKGWSRRMFISGVYLKVRRVELAEVIGKPRRLFECCVELGKQAVNTRTNARETADWIAVNRIKSVRLVTSDWHMRRARLELDREITSDVRVVSDAVPSRPALAMLFNEYHKFLARRAATLAGF